MLVGDKQRIQFPYEQFDLWQTVQRHDKINPKTKFIRADDGADIRQSKHLDAACFHRMLQVRKHLKKGVEKIAPSLAKTIRRIVDHGVIQSCKNPDIRKSILHRHKFLEIL